MTSCACGSRSPVILRSRYSSWSRPCASATSYALARGLRSTSRSGSSPSRLARTVGGRDALAELAAHLAPREHRRMHVDVVVGGILANRLDQRRVCAHTTAQAV